MATSNRRVAAYLPPEVDKAFLEYKIQRGLATEEAPNQNDSQALIQMMSEYLEVTHSKAHPITHYLDLLQDERFQDLCKRVGALEQMFVGSPSSELNDELLKKIDQLERRVENIEASRSKDSTLSTGELAKRLGMDSSTLSHWKSGKKSKSPDGLLKATRDRDPEGIGWILIPELNRFKPEKPLPSDSPAVQGELLSATPSDQVNPLPEGSERSGEG